MIHFTFHSPDLHEIYLAAPGDPPLSRPAREAGAGRSVAGSRAVRLREGTGKRESRKGEPVKYIRDTLKPVIARWDYPGDYPSGAGSAPLPSHDYVESVEGEVVVELEPADFLHGFDGATYDLPHGIQVREWEQSAMVTTDGKLQVALTVAKFDADEVERDAGAEEGDY